MATASERNPIRNRGLIFIPYDDHEGWLKIRKGYIGGSDAGAIIGVNPWNSAFSVWAEKTGQVPEFQGNVATKVGSYLEDLVARLFMEETGKKVQRCNFTIVNLEYPWACANIDREVIGEDAILEIKTTNSFENMKMLRNGEYPDMWYAQMTHYLAVTGAKKAYLAVLIESRDFKIFELERDEKEIQALMDAEKNFWHTYVVTKRTPPTDGSIATTETIKKLFNVSSDLIEADLAGCELAFQQRKALKEQIDKLKEEVDKIENSIKVVMGEASVGTCGNFKVTWKTQRTSGLDREAIKADYPDIDFTKYATESRVFRINEKKGKK